MAIDHFGCGGVVAVEAFFVVSGFYMALVLSGPYAHNKRAFYINRSLRIFPEFWIVALATLAFRILTTDGLAQAVLALPIVAQAVLGMANTGIFGSDLLMFLTVHGDAVEFGQFQDSAPPLYSLLLIPQDWTLALELMSAP